VLCYPSPFSAGTHDRGAIGTYWGAALPVNHKFDLLPDYIVFNDTFDLSDATNNAMAAGIFRQQLAIACEANGYRAVASPTATGLGLQATSRNSQSRSTRKGYL
jgi:hypothetical protein